MNPSRPCGTAFLGALRCRAEIGLRWVDLAGTSAGAITAALLAADYTIDELDSILGDLDYEQFVARRTSRASPARARANCWLAASRGISMGVLLPGCRSDPGRQGGVGDDVIQAVGVPRESVGPHPEVGEGLPRGVAGGKLR
jgi:hypothetical protein